MVGNKNGLNNAGKYVSDETKRKQRLARIKQIEFTGGKYHPSYNREACEFFKSFDEQNNTKGQYAVYGNGEYFIKELGYWVDYFNPNLKLIMEYDEQYHFDNGKLRSRDARRQKEIMELYPDYEFRRIRE